MERAVIAKLSNPGLTLHQALAKGGFVFRSKITGRPIGIGALNSVVSAGAGAGTGAGEGTKKGKKSRKKGGGNSGGGAAFRETADQIVDQDGKNLPLACILCSDIFM